MNVGDRVSVMNLSSALFRRTGVVAQTFADGCLTVTLDGEEMGPLAFSEDELMVLR